MKEYLKPIIIDEEIEIEDIMLDSIVDNVEDTIDDNSGDSIGGVA